MAEQVSKSPDAIDNAERSRFKLYTDGELADLVYRRHGDRLVLIHTELPPELEGRGIGGRLATAVIDRAALLSKGLGGDPRKLSATQVRGLDAGLSRALCTAGIRKHRDLTGRLADGNGTGQAVGGRHAAPPGLRGRS